MYDINRKNGADSLAEKNALKEKERIFQWSFYKVEQERKSQYDKLLEVGKMEGFFP